VRGPIGLFGGNRVSTHLITVELGGPILYVGEQVEGSCEVSPRNPLDGMQGAPLGNPIRAAYTPQGPPTGAVALPQMLDKRLHRWINNGCNSQLFMVVMRIASEAVRTDGRASHARRHFAGYTRFQLKYSDSHVPGTTVPPWSRFGHLGPSLQVVSISQIVCAPGHCSSLREQAVMHMRLCSEAGRAATLFGYKTVTQGFFRPRHETPIPSNGVDWRSEAYTPPGRQSWPAVNTVSTDNHNLTRRSTSGKLAR
jgi:hypothetical protein